MRWPRALIGLPRSYYCAEWPELGGFGACRTDMETPFTNHGDRRVVWSWCVKGTSGKCRLLWKLDESGAKIWARNHGVELVRIAGSSEARLVDRFCIYFRARAFQRPPLATGAEVRLFPRLGIRTRVR